MKKVDLFKNGDGVMKKESLEALKDIITNGLDKNKNIDIIDKTELLINMNKLLENEEVYEKSIKVLRKEFKKGR